jgi:tetratricopeptide (TPR) repeat protein
MKTLKNPSLLAALLAAWFFPTLSPAQIEIGEYNKNKYSVMRTYFPEPLQLDFQKLISKLNANIQKVNTMAGNMGAWQGLKALDDRFDTQSGTMFFYRDIFPDKKIVVYKNNSENDWGVSIPVSMIRGKPDQSVSFHFSSLENARTFAENMFFIQQPLRAEQLKAEQSKDSLIRKEKDEYDSKLNKFQVIARDYRELLEKPSVSEEQRRLIVQANALNTEKKYIKALEYFEKALEINPASYPAAYYNMALISAQTGRYEYAIFNMKKYLMLVPDATDARTAQDKIYEWELKQ